MIIAIYRFWCVGWVLIATRGNMLVVIRTKISQ